MRPPLPVPNHLTYVLLFTALNETPTSSTANSHTQIDQLSDRDAEGESDDEFS